MPLLDYTRTIINFLMIFSTINDNYLVNAAGETSLKIIIGLFIIANWKYFLTFPLAQTSIKRPFIVLIFFILLSFSTNYRLYTDWQQPLNIFIAICAIFIVFSQERTYQKYIWCYIISVVWSCFLCITSKEFIGEFSFRKTGGTGDPNEFSQTVLIAIGLILGYYHTLQKKYKILIGTSYFLFVPALILAASKSALLSLIILLAIFIIYRLAIDKNANKHSIIGGITAIILISVWFIGTFYAESMNLFLLRFEDNGSAQERLLSWQAGTELFIQNPCFGIGFNNYAHQIAVNFPQIVEGSRAAHNMHIQAIVELGIGGFISYTYFFIAPIYIIIKNKLINHPIIWGWLAIIIMGNSLALLGEKYVWIILSLIYNYNLIYNENYRNNTST